MLKAWHFIKNKLCHRLIDNNWQKIFRTNIFENGTGQIVLIVILMVDLWLKLQMETVELNDSIFTCLLFWHVFVWVLRAVMYHSAEARPGPSQASKINLFFFFFFFFSIWVFFHNHSWIHRTAGEGGGHFFNSSLPLPSASQTLRH